MLCSAFVYASPGSVLLRACLVGWFYLGPLTYMALARLMLAELRPQRETVLMRHVRYASAQAVNLDDLTLCGDLFIRSGRVLS